MNLMTDITFDASAIVSLVCCVVSTIIAPVLLIVIKRDIARRDRSRNEAENRHREERRADVLENVGIVVKPLSDKIDLIEDNLAKGRKATITDCRATLKAMRDRYVNQGYADHGDKATWKELYEDYKLLGGNHFREYVDQWKAEVEALPLEKQSKKPKK